MELLLKAGIDPRIRLEYDETLCHVAAQRSDAGVLQVLVAPVDEVNMLSNRPICFATKNENEEVMSILLAAGCSLEPLAGDLAGAAACNRNHNVLAMLMKAGVDINAMDYDECFPIHRAAQNPNVAVVRLLIDAGVDVNMLDCNDENPLFLACENMEVLDALLAAGAEWRDVESERTVCHVVARNTNEAIVRRVIERGVDVNAFDADGMTPLMTAGRRIEHCGSDVNLS